MSSMVLYLYTITKKNLSYLLIFHENVLILSQKLAQVARKLHLGWNLTARWNRQLFDIATFYL